MSDKYEDIINLPHHVSKRHRQMPLEERAAQFAPFAALEGHAAAVSSTAQRVRLQMEEAGEGREYISAITDKTMKNRQNGESFCHL